MILSLVLCQFLYLTCRPHSSFMCSCNASRIDTTINSFSSIYSVHVTRITFYFESYINYDMLWPLNRLFEVHTIRKILKYHYNKEQTTHFHLYNSSRGSVSWSHRCYSEPCGLWHCSTFLSRKISCQILFIINNKWLIIR